MQATTGRLYVESLLSGDSRKEFDMTSTTHRRESNAAALYVALELSATEWGLTMGTTPGGRTVSRRVGVGDGPALRAAFQAAMVILAVPTGAAIRSCYEAGGEGLWPHRLLISLGVDNVVVDSSSIEVSRRAKHAKTDRLDGARLLRLLMRHWQGEREMWHVVHVPPPALEDRRHANRTRTMLQVERTRYRNRLQALLRLHGVRARLAQTRPAHLAEVRDWAGEPLAPGVQARIRTLWTLLTAVEAERAQARRAEAQAIVAAPADACARRLTQLRGVAARSANVLADELFSRDLRTRREVGGITGLVSAPHQSGTRRVDQGLTRGGLPRVRHIAGQLAWAWLRYQPTSALSRWYRARFAGRGVVAQRIGIVALARRLMVALWRYVTVDAVPEGARMKA
jgi:transposase